MVSVGATAGFDAFSSATEGGGGVDPDTITGIATLEVDIGDGVVEASVRNRDQSHLTELVLEGGVVGHRVVIEPGPNNTESSLTGAWVSVELAAED